MVETQIAAAKVRAYRASDYRIGYTDQAIVLSPGLRSAQMAQLFASHGVNCGAFITAFNPQGAQRSTAENEQAHQQLISQIESGRTFDQDAFLWVGECAVPELVLLR